MSIWDECVILAHKEISLKRVRMCNMKIAMLGYTEGGGAGRAMMRLAGGLSQVGEICRIFVRHKVSCSEMVSEVGRGDSWLDNVIQEYFKHNVALGHVLMSAMYSGAEDTCERNLLAADVVHLHWVANFISPEYMARLSGLGKPLIWTLHDKNPMTGGCHCSYGCNGYISTNCHCCQELKDNPYDITAHLLDVKEKYFPKDLVLVSPSQWLAECAKKSRLFRKHRIEVIPNSVELDVFHPVPKEKAKAAFGISALQKVLLYGAEAHTQIHKGFSHFVAALRYACEHTFVGQLVSTNALVLVLVGSCAPEAEEELRGIGVPYRVLGYIKSDVDLVHAYSAADVMVLSSVEDNLPNMMLESLACGTPVVAYHTGGIPDIIQNGLNGYVATWGDHQALGEAIENSLMNADVLQANCRSFAEKILSPKRQADAYRLLYRDLMEAPHKVSHVQDKFELSVDSLRALGPYFWEALQGITKLHDQGGWTEILYMEGEIARRNVLEFVANWLQDVCNINHQVALWGAGEDARKLLEIVGIGCNSLLGIFDQRKNSGEVFCGYPILDKTKIMNLGLKAIVVSSLDYEEEITNRLQYLQQYGMVIIRMSDLYSLSKTRLGRCLLGRLLCDNL